jgi:competence protein ComEC
MTAPPASAGPPTFEFRPARQPMLWAALAYSVGIAAGISLWRPPSWWIAAAVFIIGAAVYFSRRRVWLACSLALIAFFLAGALHIQVRTIPLDNGIQVFADGHDVHITAHLLREGRLREAAFGEVMQTIDLETEDVRDETGQGRSIHSGLRLNIYTPRTRDADAEETLSTNGLADSMPLFHYGQRIRFSAKLRLPRNFRNPGAFDYQGYLASRGIAALGSTNIEDVEVFPGFIGSRIEHWRTRAHSSIIARVHQLWPPREAALIDAMVIGEEAFIDRDTRIDFQRSGTYHILVVSGMNVSILAFLVFWTLRRLHVADIPATLFTIGGCCAYAFLTDVGAPVWRATLMCAIYLGTRLLYRDRAMVNAVGAAAFALLVFDPRQLFTASFQMTFVCVLIVAAIGLPFLERTSGLYRRSLANWDSEDYARSLPPRVAQFRVDLHFIAARLARFIGEPSSRRLIRFTTKAGLAAFELFFISAVMQMGLALPMAFYFHRATTVGLPANLLVVPLTEVMMPAAIAALASGYLSPMVGQTSGSPRHACRRRHHPHRPRSRQAAPRRPPCGQPGPYRGHMLRRCSGLCHGCTSPSNCFCCGRSGRDIGGLSCSCIRSACAKLSPRRSGDHFD